MSQRPAAHGDVSVIGCPALEKFGADAVTGVGLDFSCKAKASFAYLAGGDSAVSEPVTRAVRTCALPFGRRRRSAGA